MNRQKFLSMLLTLGMALILPLLFLTFNQTIAQETAVFTGIDNSPNTKATLSGIVPYPGEHIVHIATANNIFNSPSYTYIDHPLLNGNQSQRFIVTQNWNPNGSSGIYNDHHIGVWYDNTEGKWVIYNENLDALTEEASFHLYIPGNDDIIITHQAYVTNTLGHITLLDDPSIPPDANLFVTHVWNPTGDVGTVNDHPIGIVYDDTLGWGIANQDLAAMPAGTAYSVLITIPQQDPIITHTATASNSVSHVTYIDDPRLNGNPNAIPTVSHLWKENSSEVYNPHTWGIWYDDFEQKWSIFNQDLADMTIGATFQVYIPEQETAVFTHLANEANSIDNLTYLDHPLLNNNPNAVVLATQNWNPLGQEGTYNDHPIGVWYDNSEGRWSIFNQDIAVMTDSVAFNVFVPSIGSNAATHIATITNTTSNWSSIQHFQLNGDPSATPLFTQNWNPNGIGGIYNNQSMGLWYDGSQVAVFNQDGTTPIPIGSAYNYYVPTAEDVVINHMATVTNTTLNWTTIDHPLLNENPHAILIVSQNWNLDGASSIYNDRNIGVWYNDNDEKWGVFNQDLEAMPEGASFIILAFDPDFAVYLPTIIRDASP